MTGREKMGWFKEDKLIIVLLLAVLLFIVSAWSGYYVFGHQAIQALYENTSSELVGSLIEARTENPLEYYLEKSDKLFPEIMGLISIFFVIILILFLCLKSSKIKYARPYPIEIFYLIAGSFLVQWYFWFMDDAFIYFRYIDNLLFLDIGLVYNKGEYVDGLSSPGWVFMLTLLRAVKMNYWVILRLAAAVSYVFFWFMLVQLNRKLSPKAAVINFPLAYLVCNYGVVSYFSGGLESPVTHVLAVAYALFILNPSSFMLQLFLAYSPMIRHELILPFGLATLWAWFYHRQFPFRMVIMASAFLGSWVLFRIYYYAELLPNTFYLKNVVDIKQGLIFVNQVLSTYHFYIVAAVFIILILLLRKKQVQLEPAKRLMMLVTAAPVALYVIKIGGDAMHYKYLAFPFVLAVCSLSGLLEHFLETYRFAKYTFIKPLAGVMIAVTVFMFYPPQISSHPFFINVEVNQVDKMYEAAKHRQRVFSEPLHWSEILNIRILQEYKEENEIFDYTVTERAQGCYGSYMKFDKRIIHGLGLTEPILARTDMRVDSPAHKLGLKKLGDDIVDIHNSSDRIGRGMYRKAVEDGRAPEWIKKNLDTLELIERKIYNEHNFLENLGLAFTFTEKIQP